MSIRNPRETKRRRMASYGPADDQGVERVIAVDGDSVITQHGDVRTRYDGVSESVRVGDVIEQPPRHTSRIVAVVRWSPFDVPGAEDDEAQTGRTF